MPEAILFESRGHGWVVQHGEVALLGFGRRDEADGLQKPAIVEPVHPLEGCELDGLEGAPRSPSMDDLSLVEAVDRFGEGVVVRVADAADGRLDPGFGETLGVLDRDIFGGFNRSSQRSAYLIVESDPALLQAFSNLAFFLAWRSKPWLRPATHWRCER